MSSKYITVISSNECTNLIKYGYTKVRKSSILEYKDTETDVDPLLDGLPPFEYSSEYVFIVFNGKNRLINILEIKYDDIDIIIPFDKASKKELELRYNYISITQPYFEKNVDLLFSKMSVRNRLMGSDVLIKMCNLKSKTENFDLQNIIKEFTDIHFHKSEMENSSLWIYLLVYERHEPYPKNGLGYLFDALHVFVNYTSRCQLEEMPSSEALEALHYYETTGVIDLYHLLGSIKENVKSQKFIHKSTTDGLNYYFIAPLFLYLFDFFSDCSFTNISLKKREFIKFGLSKRNKKELVIALRLAGAKIGYSKLSKLYYDYCNNKTERSK